MPATAETVCQIYPGQIPDFVHDALCRLHPGRYSSLEHLQIYGHATDASTYTAWRGAEPDTVLLYRRQGPLIRILNEGIVLTPQQLLRCAHHLLHAAPPADAVLFRAIAVPPCRHALLQRVDCEQDSILQLPASVTTWRQRLGAATRSTINNRLNKLRREHPTFRFDVMRNEQIDPADLHALIALHRQRVGTRSRAPIDADEAQRIQHMSQRCGLVGVARIHGRCCGGAIAYQHGAVAAGRILAHDQAYDSYRLGFLSAYLLTCHCIEQGMLRQFHFGWGQQAYKFHLGAELRTLSDVIIYRNALQRLRLAPLGLRLAARGLAFQLRRTARRLRTPGSPG